MGAKIVFAFALLLLAALSSCANVATSNPPRTATEQLLISTAADRAASELAIEIPADRTVFIDGGSTFEGTDSKYALGTIRASMLRRGVKLVDDRKDAELVMQIRAGSLSTDHSNLLVGIPSFNIPIPLATTPFQFPQIALYSNEEQKGIAKFAVAIYDAKNGNLIEEPDPAFGFSRNDKETAAIAFSWQSDDILPEEGSHMNNGGQMVRNGKGK